ncbi:hypothetical protein CFRS1_v012461 [Colletotrichum fructicola]|nr:hypothetical protein CFRS1_v012461 [Colletotrichum fructicola]
MALVCISGVYDFPGLVTFGGRIKDGPAKSSISISLTSTHPRSIDSKYLVCPADDELLPCLVSCLTFDDVINTLSIDIVEESEASKQRVRDIVGQVQEGISALPTDPARAADLWLSAVYIHKLPGTQRWLGTRRG